MLDICVNWFSCSVHQNWLKICHVAFFHHEGQQDAALQSVLDAWIFLFLSIHYVVEVLHIMKK